LRHPDFLHLHGWNAFAISFCAGVSACTFGSVGETVAVAEVIGMGILLAVLTCSTIWFVTLISTFTLSFFDTFGGQQDDDGAVG
jgi:hypothetical protein